MSIRKSSSVIQANRMSLDKSLLEEELLKYLSMQDELEAPQLKKASLGKTKSTFKPSRHPKEGKIRQISPLRMQQHIQTPYSLMKTTSNFKSNPALHFDPLAAKNLCAIGVSPQNVIIKETKRFPQSKPPFQAKFQKPSAPSIETVTVLD